MPLPLNSDGAKPVPSFRCQQCGKQRTALSCIMCLLLSRKRAVYPRYMGTERHRPLPPYPTEALPGSEEKIRVMSWRISKGYHLNHPADAKGHVPI